MGTYLKFKLGQTDDRHHIYAANNWLATQPETEKLEDIEYAQVLHFWSDIDEALQLRYWERECGYNIDNVWDDDAELGFFPDRGKGQVKMISFAPDRVYELWTQLFEKLHSHPEFDVKILSDSCALSDTSRFSPEQMHRLTDGGDSLTGTRIDDVLDRIESPDSDERTEVTGFESVRDAADPTAN